MKNFYIQEIDSLHLSKKWFKINQYGFNENYR